MEVLTVRSSHKKKKQTSSVYDCTVKDVEYICNILRYWGNVSCHWSWFAERPSCYVWCVAMVTVSVLWLVASSVRVTSRFPVLPMPFRNLRCILHQKEVCRRQISRVRWMFDNSYMALGQEVVYTDRSMQACVVMQQTPLSTPVHLWANTLHAQQ